jgi:membrane protease YdiL (CAAX protease family)
MSVSNQVANDIQTQQQAPWWEILLVMFLSLGISLISPSLKLIGILIPVAYLIIERRMRHRTWTEIGFNLHGIPTGLRQNLGWILLVGVGIQALAAFCSYYFLPAYFQHILARLPLDLTSLNVGLIVALGISTLGEEILYRGLFQARIGTFMPATGAIVLTSLVFAWMHYSSGAALIVMIDLTSVLIDSVIFGIIFQRSQNIFVAWIAHFLGDIVGVIFLLMMMK